MGSNRTTINLAEMAKMIELAVKIHMAEKAGMAVITEMIDG